MWKALEPHVDTAFLPEEIAALPTGVSTPGCARSSKDGDVKELDPVCEDPTDMKVALRSTAKVSDREKVMPRGFITRDGFGITPRCRTYLKPLIRGEDYPPYKDGLPRYVELTNCPVTKKLDAEFEIR